MKVNTHSDRNVRRGGYARNALPANSGNMKLKLVLFIYFFLDMSYFIS